jgi:hypothetical protein
MPFYDVWEKKTVFMPDAGSPPVLPPGAGGPAPPGIWPGPHPSHPIMLPGMPGWGSGNPVPPPLHPGIWPGPQPSHPIMLPGMPGWEPPSMPSPPDQQPPTDPPTGPPDLDSPGFWTRVTYPDHTRLGFIQLALNTSPDHEPRPPEKGLPGTWIAGVNSLVGYTYVWLPTIEEPEAAAAHAHSRAHTKKKSS